VKSQLQNLEKIISGGQTGADRAALDWAIKNAIPHGGWCPKERKADFSVSLLAVLRSVDGVLQRFANFSVTSHLKALSRAGFSKLFWLYAEIANSTFSIY